MESTPVSPRHLPKLSGPGGTSLPSSSQIALSTPSTHAHPSNSSTLTPTHSHPAILSTFQPTSSYLDPLPTVRVVPTPLILTESRQEERPDCPRSRANEADEIVRKLGCPDQIVHLVLNNTVTTRADLLVVMRKEVQRIRLNLDLEPWIEEQDTNVASDVTGEQDGSTANVDFSKAEKKLGWAGNEGAGVDRRTAQPDTLTSTRSIAALDLSSGPSRRRSTPLELR
ncbi:hypothetical protein MMC13_006918 [Lambiella insularis]|nr:hypothetical protein [Lambiella insularis]